MLDQFELGHWPSASRARCRAGSAAASTSRSGSSTAPSCCSSTSRRPDSTRRAAPTSGSTSSAARGRRHDDLPDHALPRRGRQHGRARHGHGPRRDHRRRHRPAAKDDLAGDHITITTATDQDRAATPGSPRRDSVEAGRRVGRGGVGLGRRDRAAARRPRRRRVPGYLRALDTAAAVTLPETARPTLDDVFLSLKAVTCAKTTAGERRTEAPARRRRRGPVTSTFTTNQEPPRGPDSSCVTPRPSSPASSPRSCASPPVLLFSMGQPLLFLFLFGSLLDGGGRLGTLRGSGSCPASWS